MLTCGKSPAAAADAPPSPRPPPTPAAPQVQGLMARYRRGEYVSEDELEWAFR
jgi:hypothetical protein